MPYSPYFALEGGAKEKMTLIWACQPWHPWKLLTSVRGLEDFKATNGC